MPQFHETMMGRKFIEADVESLKRSFKAISKELAVANELKDRELKLREKELNLKEQELHLKQNEIEIIRHRR